MTNLTNVFERERLRVILSANKAGRKAGREDVKRDVGRL